MPSTKILHGDEFVNESAPHPGRMCEYGFSYDSGTNDSFLTVEQLKQLIKKL